MLIWKTKYDDEMPQGKQRVYFVCHPDDFDEYFRPVCELLFQYADCIVWYKQNFNELFDDSDLKQIDEMQLFVFPVTKKLLSDKNTALDAEINYAWKRNIPILPLAFENGLDKAFNEKYGDIQMLEMKDLNYIVIPFEDKLKRFLSSVLLGDKLTEQIRNAFEGFIFLSYRKKDREYAQKLMRLIHANDFARDFAIWYDDYLDPGEKFTDAIQLAMEQK